MTDNLIVEKLQAALERQRQQSAREHWDELVRRGAIDAEGKVLVRGPESRDEATPRKGRAKKGT